jgi:hypothetical protein
MYKVLIAAQAVGWSTISLLMGGCSSSSNSTPTTQNLITQENSISAPTSTDRHPNSTKPQTILASTNTTSPNPASVPDVNPLNSIVGVAKRQISDTSSSSDRDSLKSSSLPNLEPKINTDGKHSNLQLKQVSNVSDLPKPSLQLSEQPTNNRAKTTSSLADSCHTFPCLILSQDRNMPLNRFNNPIYKLTAYQTKKSNYIFQLDAVTGRSFTQHRNRYQSNTEAPLPDGSYSIAARVVAGTIREVGGTMVPIFPKPGFDPQMRRTALGIHWDPSFDKDEKEDGTSGCIGLTKKNDYHRVRDFILKYRPRYLEVKITQ